MRSIDTNVIARWLMRDDPDQAVIADRIMNSPIEISHTVLVEIAWVLTGAGKMSRAQFADTMEAILSIDDAVIAQRDRIAWAVDRYREGADWPDVVHVATSLHAETFSTFDKALCRQAGATPPLAIEIL